jgi:hypothetical protein
MLSAPDWGRSLPASYTFIPTGCMVIRTSFLLSFNFLICKVREGKERTVQGCQRPSAQSNKTKLQFPCVLERSVTHTSIVTVENVLMMHSREDSWQTM